MAELIRKPRLYYENIDSVGRVDFVELRDGRSIAYKRSGHGEHTVFDFHGSPGGRNNPVPRNFVLNQLMLNVVTFDRPGYGYSSRNYGRKVADTASDVEQMMDALKVDRTAVIARSGGGPHALATAAKLGKRATALVGMSGLAPRYALNTWNNMTEDNKKKHDLARKDRDELGRNMYSHARSLMSNAMALLNHIAREFPNADRLFFELNPGAAPDVARNHRDALITGAAGWVDDSVALNDLSWGFAPESITCPSIFWHGSDDRFADVSHTHALRELVPGSASIISKGKGHFDSLTSVVPALGYIGSRIAAEKRDGEPSQASLEDLASLFQDQTILRLGEAPIRPEIVMHGSGQQAS
ncbi:MAG TPA: alpha/beta hydrolase [Candidatus Saccharimonadales bacterium]|nr:alpha/beta hydrolase [Candidatus Saccharimonadales bacterium]